LHSIYNIKTISKVFKVSENYLHCRFYHFFRLNILFCFSFSWNMWTAWYIDKYVAMPNIIFFFSNGGIYLTMTGRLIMIDASNHMCQYVKYVVRSITKKTISTTLLRRSNELDQYFHSNLFVPWNIMNNQLKFQTSSMSRLGLLA